MQLGPGLEIRILAPLQGPKASTGALAQPVQVEAELAGAEAAQPAEAFPSNTVAPR